MLQRLYDLARQERAKTQQLGVAKQRIHKNEQRIGVLSTQLRAAQDDLQTKKEILRRRVTEMYKAGGFSHLELLFTADSISDFLNRSVFFQRVLTQDVGLITEIDRQFRQVRSAKVELEGATDEVRQLGRLIAAKRAEIQEQAEQKKQIFQLVQSKRKEYEKRVEALERASLELEHLIRKLTATQRDDAAVMHSTGRFMWPATGRLTSRFGYRRHPLWGGTRFHHGLDIAAPFGTRIVASDGGEVILSGWWNGYGKAVVIRHVRGKTTVYGHMSRIFVKMGDGVQKGQLIGLVGSTGFSTGPHLHFEIRLRGKPVNPLTFLR